MKLEEIKEYLDEDYWECGKSVGKSGYENWGIDEWWCGRLIEALSMVQEFKGKDFLDIGCGTAGIVYSALHSGINAFGIDFSHYAIEKAKRLKPELSGRIFECSAHDLSIFDRDSFDFIFSNQVFEHIPEELVPEMLREIKRVMRPRATAWIGLVIDDETTEKDPNDPDKTHITLRSRVWWHKQIEDAGLVLDYDFDSRFRQTKLPIDGYSFFEEYGWHGFSFRTKQNAR
jgi:ubiquinone/menaquinone biosynthesis C-methylase UbiE